MQAPELYAPLRLSADRVEQEATFQNDSEIAAQELVRAVITLDNDAFHLGLLAHEIFRITGELQEGRAQSAMRYEEFAKRTNISVYLIHEHSEFELRDRWVCSEPLAILAQSAACVQRRAILLSAITESFLCLVATFACERIGVSE